jgi:hypothetical protein
MAKANIKLPDGTTVSVEGSAEDISTFVQKLQGSTPASTPTDAARPSKAKAARKVASSSRPSLVDLIDSLVDGGFFRKKPQDLAAVKGALEEMGHHYPVTTLSGAMLTQVRKRKLRRLKNDKRWVYTG